MNVYEDDSLESAYEDQHGAPQGNEQDDHDYPSTGDMHEPPAYPADDLEWGPGVVDRFDV